MKFLVIGLGSMGKRRIRCLKSLGYSDIVVFDNNDVRLYEVSEKYAVKPVNDPKIIIKDQLIDAVIISTSPESHMIYAPLAFKNNLPSFIEASVCDLEKISNLNKIALESDVLIAPSCTMKYFEGPKLIKKLISEKKIGQILYFEYRTGQYLPDWHPWENIKDFYVSNRITGGCKEIVPFELTWLNQIFGDPDLLSSMKGRIGLKNVDIDDFYHFSLKYPNNVIANITIEVLSQPNAMREIRITGDEGQIVFNQDDNVVKFANKDTSWKSFYIEEKEKEQGYINPEKPYIDELNDFINAVRLKNNSIFPNTLSKDLKVLKLLKKIDSNSKSL